MSKIYKQLSKNDECYTPKYGVKPIVDELKAKILSKSHKPVNMTTIWCPFDTKNSEFALSFREAGFNVITSHIYDGKDFLKYEPTQKYDYIISNPPFTNKRIWVERAIELKKPFAFLLPASWLNDPAPFLLDINLDILMFDKRINFGKPGISFKAIYFSTGIMKENYKVVKLDKPKPKDEIKSNMWKDLKEITKYFETKERENYEKNRIKRTIKQ